MAKRLVRILLGHDGVQRRRGQGTSESDGPRTPRTVLLGPERNIQYNHKHCKCIISS